MNIDQQNLGFSGMMQYLGSLKQSFREAAAFLLGVARKYWWLLLLAAILGGGWKWYSARGQRPSYEVRMCCAFNDNHQKIFGEMILRLNTLLQQDSRKEAARLLQMPVEQVKEIASVAALTLALGRLEDDFSEKKLPFYIDARVYDRDILPVLQQSLLRYLNNNDLSARELARKKQKWADRVAFYNQQLMKLDSLKESIRVSYAVSNAGHPVPATDQAIADIYRISDSMDFYREDFSYYKDHYETVSSIYGFAPADEPQAPEMRSGIIRFALAGFILSWLLMAGIVLLQQAPGKQAI